MTKVKLNLWNLTVPEKIIKARSIVDQMKDNTFFPNPKPSLQEMRDAIRQLEASYEAALDGGHSLKAKLRIDHDAFMDYLGRLAAYVQNESGGSEEIIRSSGFDIRLPATASRAPEAPPELKRADSTHEGEVSIKWVSVKYARAYVLQWSDNPGDEKGWVYLTTCCTTTCTVRDLRSLSIRWFRVAAVGLKGQSDFSQPIKAFIR